MPTGKSYYGRKRSSIGTTCHIGLTDKKKRSGSPHMLPLGLIKKRASCHLFVEVNGQNLSSDPGWSGGGGDGAFLSEGKVEGGLVPSGKALSHSGNGTNVQLEPLGRVAWRQAVTPSPHCARWRWVLWHGEGCQAPALLILARF